MFHVVLAGGDIIQNVVVCRQALFSFSILLFFFSLQGEGISKMDVGGEAKQSKGRLPVSVSWSWFWVRQRLERRVCLLLSLFLLCLF